jgi:hypothetical protein
VIARKVRTAKELALLKYKQLAPIGIGKTRQQISDAYDRAEAAWIRRVHDQVWAAHETCQLCYGLRSMFRDADQMHEDPPRSATRNFPLEQRFSRTICGRLCVVCHDDVTNGRLKITFLQPELGFMGAIVGDRVF